MSVASSGHAELRYLQRVDPTEPFPREKIVAMIKRGVEIQHPNVSAAKAIFDPETGMVAVFDDRDEEVITLFTGGVE